MAGLFKNNPKTRGGKYLLLRRDGTVPRWPFFVIGARDPAAEAGIKAYADKAEELGYDPRYVSDVRALIPEFAEWLDECGPADPDAPPHRKDDPATIARMHKEGRGA